MAVARKRGVISAQKFARAVSWRTEIVTQIALTHGDVHVMVDRRVAGIRLNIPLQ